MPVYERNLMAFESFTFAGGGPVELHLADVAADLHAVGAGVHPEGASDGAGDADESFHAAEVVFRAESRSEEHTSELQSHLNLVCRLLLEKKKKDRRRRGRY